MGYGTGDSTRHEHGAPAHNRHLRHKKEDMKKESNKFTYDKTKFSRAPKPAVTEAATAPLDAPDAPGDPHEADNPDKIDSALASRPASGEATEGAPTE